MNAVATRHDGHRVKRLPHYEGYCFECFETFFLLPPIEIDEGTRLRDPSPGAKGNKTERGALA